MKSLLSLSLWSKSSLHHLLSKHSQSLYHIYRCYNEDPVFHFEVHNPLTSILQILRSHHTSFAHPFDARNSSK
jgi:hypothetical protein